MKKINLFWYCVLVCVFASCNDDENGPVLPAVINFPDGNLELAIREALELGADESINTENILGLESLNLRNAEVTNLTGLESAENLISLDLREQQIADLGPIAELKGMEWLSLRETLVTDISMLEGFNDLVYLNLNRLEGITDISSLAGATRLEELIIRDVQFGDEGMEVIRNFTNLYRLNMRNCNVTQVDALAHLMENGALRDTPDQMAVIDIRDNDIPNEPGNDGYAPIRPFYENLGDRSPNNLPDPMD
ncbi:leucine-rich repeat domain-containing protein [Pleomorphovibrio marinus]|uniref:hypothetical protein n=1 Tax=Pleomorphovibrio marinus TaxID=2164132 RepID=UPI000E0A4EAE|nr:hypothetical protein [Pleomorphovibrio marinus]